jgi:hypothetical protein
VLTICAYCKRETKDGRAVGKPVTDLQIGLEMIYPGVSHGACCDCIKIEREKLAQYREEKENVK